MSYIINLANNILAFQGTLTRPLRHQEKLVKQLCELAIIKDARIAELEAELNEMREATKQRYKTTMKVQTAIEAEEGEG